MGSRSLPKVLALVIQAICGLAKEPAYEDLMAQAVALEDASCQRGHASDAPCILELLQVRASVTEQRARKVIAADAVLALRSLATTSARRSPLRKARRITPWPIPRDLLQTEAVLLWNKSDGVCISDRNNLPTAWKPSEAQLRLLSNTSTKENLTIAAVTASHEAYRELVEFLHLPGKLEEQEDEALEAIINVAFAGSNMPDLQQKALLFARDIVVQLAAGFTSEANATCTDLNGKLVPMVRHCRYIHQKTPTNETLEMTMQKLVNYTNRALADCGDLGKYLGFDPSERLGHYPPAVDDAHNATNGYLYDMLMQAIDLVGLLANPDLAVPSGALKYLVDFWTYLSKFPFPMATDLPRDDMWPFVDVAYFISHTVYFVTSYARYSLQVNDTPWLFKWVRENYYTVLEAGHLDLIGKFVDALRQYGCNEDNDAQTRDGLQVLLTMYDKADQNWMKIPDWTDGDGKPSDYNLMHKPWAVFGGIRRPVFEAPTPGTEGAVMEEVLARARQATSS